MKYQCKVCAYAEMPYAPADYNICPCCGTEYCVDDSVSSYLELRNNWLRNGGFWFGRRVPFLEPPHWNAWDQLDIAGFKYSVSRPVPISKENVYKVKMSPLIHIDRSYSPALDTALATACA